MSWTRPITTGKCHLFIGVFKFVGTDEYIQIIFAAPKPDEYKLIFIGFDWEPMNIWGRRPHGTGPPTDEYRRDLVWARFLFSSFPSLPRTANPMLRPFSFSRSSMGAFSFFFFPFSSPHRKSKVAPVFFFTLPLPTSATAFA
jgi:hypothetical protein